MAAAWSPAVRGSRLHVDVAEVLEDSKAALQPVLEVTPGWGPEAAAVVVVEQVSGAMTNLVYRCRSAAAAANAWVIVRVFGTGGKLFSQKDERNIFLLASDLGIGPKCLVEFGNGRVEQFLPGEGVTHNSLREPAVSAAVAAALAVFHVRMLARLPAAQGLAPVPEAGAGAGAGREAAPGELQPAIYERIRQWWAAAAEVCGEELQRQRLGAAVEEVDALRAALARRFPAWVGFCHNDLQYGNMLLSRGGGTGGSDGAAAPGSPGGSAAAAAAEEDGAAEGAAAIASGAPSAEDGAAEGAAAIASGAPAAEDGAAEGGDHADVAGGDADVAGDHVVRLIDYEYSTLNDVAYDIANHFCEWAYNYHSDGAHVFHDDWLPSRDQQLHFCAAYVAALRRHVAAAGAAAADRPSKRRATGGSPEPELPGPGAGLAARVLGAGARAAAAAGGGVAAGDAAVAALLAEKARAHLPLVHLKWGLWGLIQDQTSDVDFDYLTYGRQRIERFHATKAAVLAA